MVAFVLLTYTLFATGGMMTALPATSRVYELLAELFMQGRLDLLLDPPPQLAAVEDPYDPAQRAGHRCFHRCDVLRRKVLRLLGTCPRSLARSLEDRLPGLVRG